MKRPARSSPKRATITNRKDIFPRGPRSMAKMFAAISSRATNCSRWTIFALQEAKRKVAEDFAAAFENVDAIIAPTSPITRPSDRRK